MALLPPIASASDSDCTGDSEEDEPVLADQAVQQAVQQARARRPSAALADSREEGQRLAQSSTNDSIARLPGHERARLLQVGERQYLLSGRISSLSGS